MSIFENPAIAITLVTEVGFEPTPPERLEEIGKFSKRFRAISQSDLMPLTFAAKATAGSDDGQLARNIGKLQ